MKMEEKAYCPCCRKQVSFTVCNAVERTVLDGETYEYPVRKAQCKACGSEAVYQPFQEEAGDNFSDAVRKRNGIITLAQIREIPRRYRIGKRPLSNLLGWGEVTYTRFMEGQVPSKRYSDELIGLYGDPAAYLRLLESGKGRISQAAYRKSRQAVEAIMNDRFAESAKIYEVADYFCDLSGNDLTPYMLQKLTYYAQGFSLVFLDGPLFSQEPKAWAAGPVYGQLWYEFKDRLHPAEVESDGMTWDSNGNSPFSADEEEFLQEVYRAFGCYSGSVLSRMTHQEGPWCKAREREGVTEGERGSEPIRLADMRTFFETVKAEHDMKDCRDIRCYARKAFREACA